MRYRRVLVLLSALFSGDECFSADIPAHGLVLQLDASSLELGDGMRVSEWPDLSHRGNHVAQNDVARQPVFTKTAIGGQPVVRFNGNALLDRPEFSGFEPVDQALHVVFVFQAPPGGGPSQRLIDLQSNRTGQGRGENQYGFWVGFQGHRYIPRLGIVNGDEGEAVTPIWDAKPHILELVYRGKQQFEIHVDGRTERKATYGGRKFLGFRKHVTLAIGQHFAHENHTPTYLTGDIAEVLVYSRALSATERFELGSHLSKKYSLQTSFKPLPQFERDIRPILAAKCFNCHGEETREAGLDLRTVSAMLTGGEAGPVVVRGHPEFSELIAVLDSGKMPPDDAEPLTAGQVALLREWVAADTPALEKIVVRAPASKVMAEDCKHWAWQLPVKHSPPEARHFKNAGLLSRARTDVDRFILANLDAAGLTLSPDAKPERLVRRLYFDLIGLPPSPQEIDAFLNDPESMRVERLVDQLLESQHFGERWGRHWLDVAGYVDVHGSDNDAAIIKQMPGKWRYRDYVIRSFNNDKPFDRFLTEQLAGDELVDWKSAKTFTPEIVEALTATSFLLSANDDTSAPELNTPDIRHHVLQRTAENIAGSLLAVTLQCARCHDHKYEAVSQVDYYRFESIFAPVFNVRDWVQADKRLRPAVSDADRTAIDRHNADIDSKLKPLQERRKQLKKATSEPEASEPGKLDAQIAELASRKRSYDTISVGLSGTASATTHVLRRGNYLRPGLEVEPSLPEILASARSDALRPGSIPTQSVGTRAVSGSRLILARALTDPDSLAGNHVARVFVNRVWQQLFGKGLVETSDNFGVSGATPSHPELLDWLTLRFIDSGWRIKPLIRLMVLSSVYQQSAVGDDASHEVDPDNRLLWRMNLRRLDSEQLRDAILTVSGQLDRSLGGPPIPLEPRPDGMVVIKTNALPAGTTANRRSVYILARRNYHMTFMRAFDQPIVARNCTIRRPAAAVTQSLALLNDDFIVKQSAAFADRVLNETLSDSPAEQIRTAWRIGSGRWPDDAEQKICVSLLKRHEQRVPTGENARRFAMSHLCQMLLNTNEFLYVP